ncbi:MAG: bifunctional nuclease family protein [Candidatus Omnitrophica bacterium]|nr:bifunctional nuclease family protein [Candidatus Omnitrophota bacterium]
MIEMELNKIVIDEKRHDQLIVLKEKGGSRLLPIVIGLNEASAIKLRLSGVHPPRPLTHDLLCSVIQSMDAVVDKIVIDKLEDNTFHAKIIVKSETGKIKIIDARPSDSIALSVRSQAPVFVEEAVLNQMDVFNPGK